MTCEALSPISSSHTGHYPTMLSLASSPRQLGEQDNVPLTSKREGQGTTFLWATLSSSVFPCCVVLEDWVSLPTVLTEARTASNMAVIPLV